MLKKSSIDTSISSFDVVKESINLASEITGTKILTGHAFLNHIDDLTDKMWELMYGGSNRPHIVRHALVALRNRLIIYRRQMNFDSRVAITPTGFPNLAELMCIDYKKEKDSTARDEILKLYLYRDEPPDRYSYTWKRQLELVSYEIIFRPRYWEEDGCLCVGWNTSKTFIRGAFYAERDHAGHNGDDWCDDFYDFLDNCPDDHNPEFYHRQKINPHLCHVGLKYINGEMRCSFRYGYRDKGKKDLWLSQKARIESMLYAYAGKHVKKFIRFGKNKIVK